MSEAMKQIKKELGSDAVILSSKPVYSAGILGLFKKRSIEVIAAVDPDTYRAPDDGQDSHLSQPVPSVSRPAEESLTDGNLFKELQELKKMVKGMSRPEGPAYPEELRAAADLLEEQELSPEIRDSVMEGLILAGESKSMGRDELFSELKRLLAEELRGVAEWGPRFTKKYISIVGPTGVGKTTTLAKAAAASILSEDKRVAFITTDTYRIAAIEQLKTYAGILNIPIEVAYNLDDFKRAADRFSHYDTVFIDTAGRNFRNPQYVKDLGGIIDFNEEMETFLVLSLTSKEKDMEEIYQQFSLIAIKQVIFTKTDETSTYGPMVNFAARNKVGVAYLTNGQNVPDDIEEASPERIAGLVAGGMGHE